MEQIMQNQYIKWLVENKEWIFSGAGFQIIAALFFIIGLGCKFLFSKKNSSVKQNQRSGSNSINNQSTGSINQNNNIMR